MTRPKNSILLLSISATVMVILASALSASAQAPPLVVSSASGPSAILPVSAPVAVASSGLAVAPLPTAGDSVKPAAPVSSAAPVGEPAPVPVEGVPKSLLLTAHDKGRISNAMADYQNFMIMKKNNPEDLGKKAEAPDALKAPEKPQKRFYTYPQFFLEWHVYHTPNDWSVRINGHKFAPPITADDAVLSILSIDGDKVVFRWKPEEMARVLESWEKVTGKDAPKSDNDSDTMKIDFNAQNIQKSSSGGVTVDKERRVVTFALHSNQTFSSFAMQVLEGKVLPVTIENKVTDIRPSRPVMGDILPADGTAPPIPMDDSNSGLNGLMKTIEKH